MAEHTPEPRFGPFEANELLVILIYLGEANMAVNPTAGKLYDEIQHELVERSNDGDTDAQDVVYNSTIPFPEAP